MEPSSPTHRVILADNQAIFRAGAARVIAREPDMEIAGECSDPALLPSVIDATPGAILLLAQTLGSSLVPVSQATRSAGAHLILLIENGAKPDPATLHCLDFVLTRSTGSDELIDAIRRVAAGERRTEVAVPPLESADPVGLRVRGELTPRELQIVGLVVQGRKNREVAAALNTQEQVVKNYLRSIYDKTGVSDRLELALFVLHHRLLAEAAERSIAGLHLRPT